MFAAKNIALKGSFCVEGDGIGVTIRTGKYTVLIDVWSEVYNSVKEITFFWSFIYYLN